MNFLIFMGVYVLTFVILFGGALLLIFAEVRPWFAPVAMLLYMTIAAVFAMMVADLVMR